MKKTPISLYVLAFIYKSRWFITFTYWTWLTVELLLSNPWALYDRSIASAPPIDTSDPISSFVCHAGAYGLLAILLFLAAGERGESSVKKWLAFGFLHGFVSELGQSFVPNRWPSYDDLFSNAFGLLAGFFLCRALWKKGHLAFWFRFGAQELLADNGNRRKALP